jgi:calcineurin-like phosphoesterase family protein
MSRLQLVGLILLFGLAGFGYWHTTQVQPSIVARPFTVIVLPDTQKYVWKYHGVLYSQIQWILDNRVEKDIRFVSQLGDLVENHDQIKSEWEEVSSNFRLLEGIIPYSVIPGNHDSDHALRDEGLTMYDHYFPASRFIKYPWYKGNRKENQDNYEIITVQTTTGPLEMLFLNLETEPSNNTIKWANEIVQAHPKAYTIVTTHKYLADDGSGRDTKREYSREGHTGEMIWQDLIKSNCSIKMVWNGHYHIVDGEDRLVSKNSCGQNVYQIVQDYQEREVGGNGRLRIYTFDPVNKIIDVQTYSPYTNTFETDYDSAFQIPFAI